MNRALAQDFQGGFLGFAERRGDAPFQRAFEVGHLLFQIPAGRGVAERLQIFPRDEELEEEPRELVQRVLVHFPHNVGSAGIALERQGAGALLFELFQPRTIFRVEPRHQFRTYIVGRPLLDLLDSGIDQRAEAITAGGPEQPRRLGTEADEPEAGMPEPEDAEAEQRQRVHGEPSEAGHVHPKPECGSEIAPHAA